MNQPKINWVLLAIVAIIGIVILANSFLPPPKIRARRIQAENNFRQVVIVTTNSPAPPKSPR
jgi:hypothetical protein